VLAQDQFGNAAPGTSITFAPSGDGSVGASPVGTDAMGIASTSWTLSSSTGPNTLVATAPNVPATPSVTFNATATVQVGSIVISAGDGQTAPVNTAVANPLIVQVLDINSVPAPGIPVTFAVTLGGGSITGPNQVTDANGDAFLGSWTLGTAATANEVQVSVDSDPTNLFVLFGATATAGAATTMAVSAGDNQTAAVGTPVGVAPAVLVTDQFSNPIQGVVVGFSPSGDGQVTGSPATTDASGIATVGSWTLATAAGGNTLDAIANLPTVTFKATGTVTSFVITIQQGNDQNGTLTGPMAVNPTVLVTDQGTGNPVAGVSVSFAPISGEGMVNSPTVMTDGSGLASVEWTLGRVGSNFMDVVAANASTQFFGIGSNSAYTMELRFLAPATTTMVHKQAFGDAAGRWMSIITGDTPDFDLNLLTPPGFAAGACFGMPNPFVNEVIDDIIIFVDLKFIDGVDGILGQAGPCGRLSGSQAPLIGGMTFDTADLANMIANGTFPEVVLHEMGHVVGIGSLWLTNDLPALITNPSCPSSTGADTHFTGTNALAEFAVITGGPWTGSGSTTSPVPVENTVGGCPGTRDGHWRESTFNTELMTGLIGAAGNPLSRTTIASVQDLGYVVDISQADPYTLFSTTALHALTQSGVRLVNDIARGPTILFLPGGGYRVEIIR
jgi:hypothetical protein